MVLASGHVNATIGALVPRSPYRSRCMTLPGSIRVNETLFLTRDSIGSESNQVAGDWSARAITSNCMRSESSGGTASKASSDGNEPNDPTSSPGSNGSLNVPVGLMEPEGSGTLVDGTGVT